MAHESASAYYTPEFERDSLKAENHYRLKTCTKCHNKFLKESRTVEFIGPTDIGERQQKTYEYQTCPDCREERPTGEVTELCELIGRRFEWPNPDEHK